MHAEQPQDQWLGMVKIGEKGQIVIPKPVRDMFGFHAGESLLLMADVNRGIAVMGPDAYRDFVEKTLSKPPLEPEE